MHLDIDAEGRGHLALEPDEPVYVKSGDAEGALSGGSIGAPDEGLLVLVYVQEPPARAEGDKGKPCAGKWSVDIRKVSEESDEP